MAAIPSAIFISNLTAAKQSLDMAQHAYNNWMERNEKNKDDLRQVLARQAALEEESIQREHDIAEGTKNLQAATAAFVEASTTPVPAPVPAPVPVALLGSPTPKRLTQKMKEAMSPEQNKAYKAAKKAAKEERKAHRTPEEQARFDAWAADMKARRASKKVLNETGDEMPALVAGASV
jgi:hypothetical protein